DPLQASSVQMLVSAVQVVPFGSKQFFAPSLQVTLHGAPPAQGSPVWPLQVPPLQTSLPLQNTPSSVQEVPSPGGVPVQQQLVVTSWPHTPQVSVPLQILPSSQSPSTLQVVLLSHDWARNSLGSKTNEIRKIAKSMRSRKVSLSGFKAITPPLP